ncbi:MAG: hypothetical protein LC662_08185, partial [Rhodothermaceae bacterium]|nr:hypothetical protein [Rhodothermaceae bacterium]
CRPGLFIVGASLKVDASLKKHPSKGSAMRSSNMYNRSKNILSRNSISGADSYIKNFASLLQDV